MKVLPHDCILLCDTVVSCDNVLPCSNVMLHITQTLVDELEDLLNKCHEKGVEDMEAIQKAAKASTAIKTNRASTAKNSRMYSFSAYAYHWQMCFIC